MIATPDSEFTLDIGLHLANNRCAEITKKPSGSALTTTGLSAWRDSITFEAKGFASLAKLFPAAVDALNANYKVVRIQFEETNGAHEVFAAEYAAIAEVDKITKERTGRIELHAQFVLKSLTVTGPTVMDQINGRVIPEQGA